MTLGQIANRCERVIRKVTGMHRDTDWEEAKHTIEDYEGTTTHDVLMAAFGNYNGIYSKKNKVLYIRVKGSGNLVEQHIITEDTGQTNE